MLQNSASIHDLLFTLVTDMIGLVWLVRGDCIKETFSLSETALTRCNQGGTVL